MNDWHDRQDRGDLDEMEGMLAWAVTATVYDLSAGREKDLQPICVYGDNQDQARGRAYEVFARRNCSTLVWVGSRVELA